MSQAAAVQVAPIQGVPIQVVRYHDAAAAVGTESVLIDLLRRQAASEGISGAEMCRRIGFHESLWSRARRGIERFGIAACTRIVVAYPHMNDAAARYLAGSLDESALRLLAEADRVVRSAEARGAGV